MSLSFLYVALGGAVGAVSRYALSCLLSPYRFFALPLGTLCVNILGCMLLGVLMAIVPRVGSTAQSWYLFLAVGFCGSFTTFSTFIADCVHCADQSFYLSLFYAALSLVLGLLAFALSFRLLTHF